MSILAHPEFAELLSNRRTVSPGEVIILEGQDGEAVFVILKGEAQAVLTDSSGKQVVINRMHAGDIFGELELLGRDRKCTATVLSEQGCELLVIDKAVVDKRLTAADPFLRFMMEHLCGIIKVWTDLARKA